MVGIQSLLFLYTFEKWVLSNKPMKQNRNHKLRLCSTHMNLKKDYYVLADKRYEMV